MDFQDRTALLREIERLTLENAALTAELQQLQAATDMYRQVITRLEERDRTMSSARRPPVGRSHVDAPARLSPTRNERIAFARSMATSAA